MPPAPPATGTPDITFLILHLLQRAHRTLHSSSCASCNGHTGDYIPSPVPPATAHRTLHSSSCTSCKGHTGHYIPPPAPPAKDTPDIAFLLLHLLQMTHQTLHSSSCTSCKGHTFHYIPPPAPRELYSSVQLYQVSLLSVRRPNISDVEIAIVA